jgi:hypothetical protein
MDRLYPPSTLANCLLAGSVTIIILDNQNNGQHGATLHRNAIPTCYPLIPVKAASHQFVQVQMCDLTNANGIISLSASTPLTSMSWLDKWTEEFKAPHCDP